jgi:NADH-quinone oxidoreductase subunit F
MESERFPQVRIALRNCGRNDPENIGPYMAGGGFDGLRKALKMTPGEVIEEVGKSRLRERSGNGFPVGEKWRLCFDAAGSEKFVICNAAEGDPNSLITRILLGEDPWSVLEGMLIGAYATGATLSWIYINAEYGAAIDRVRTALNQMEGFGLLGNRIPDSEFSFHVKIREAPVNLACGDETFLINAMECSKILPFVCSSRLPIDGLVGKPTLVHSVETWSHVSAILQKGAEWYAGYGTEQCRGTKVFTLCGEVMRPRLIEVPMGTTLRQIVYDIGGGVLEGKGLKAVQVGGPTGGYLPASALDLPIDYESLSGAGTLMGSGTLFVIDSDACMVDHARRSLSVIQGESCGKCVFCREGTMQMAGILKDIVEGKGKTDDIELLMELGEGLKTGSQCDLGRTAPNPVLTMIRYFHEELESHIEERMCQARVCHKLEPPSIHSQG